MGTKVSAHTWLFTVAPIGDEEAGIYTSISLTTPPALPPPPPPAYCLPQSIIKCSLPPESNVTLGSRYVSLLLDFLFASCCQLICPCTTIWQVLICSNINPSNFPILQDFYSYSKSSVLLSDF